MENCKQDYCSISPSGGNGGGGHNFAWVGVDSSSSSSSSSYPYPFIDKRKYTTSTNNHHQTLEILEGDDEEEEEEALPEIETLPLFPIHGQVKHQEINYFNGWRADDVAASLELTLNSYAPTSSSFPTS